MAIGDWRSHVIRKNAATYLGREGFGGTGSNLDSMDRTQLQNLIRAANDRYNPKIKELEALVATRTKGGGAYNRDKGELDKLKSQRDSQIAPAVQRLKSQRATPKQQNWQQMLKPNVQSTGNQQPATSVVDATRNAPPAPNLPPVQGEKPADLAGFARQRGYMEQQTPQQNVPRPMGNVPTEGAKTFRPPPLPNPTRRTGPPPKKPATKTSAQLSQEAQQRKVTQEATQQASPPTPQQGQRTANQPYDPPKDAQGNPIPPKEIPNVNQQLIQEQRKRQDKFLQDMRRTAQRSAKSPRQRRKDAKTQAKQQKQQAKQQARQQKTQQRLAQQQQRQQEKEAKRQAKQNPRAGGQLVRRNPNPMNNPNNRLVPKGQAPPPKSRLIPRKPRAIPVAKSDELSKSIKDILRR